jgi:hypothetical protein
MRIQLTTPQRALHPAYRKEKVSRREIDALKKTLPRLLDLCADPQLLWRQKSMYWCTACTG